MAAKLKYTPSEQAINRLLEGRTNRQLAIAYLRAKRRADDAELTVDTLMSLAEGRRKIRAGDYDGAIDTLDKTLKKFRTYNQTKEGQ